MAALRRIPKYFSGLLPQSNSSSLSLRPPPSLFIARRGVTSKLFVGGISFHTTEKGLLEAFSQYGQVIEAKVITDRVSERSKGFGFITFASSEEAEKAKTEMDGKPLDGRAVFIDYAKPQTRSTGGIPIARGPPEPITGE